MQTTQQQAIELVSTKSVKEICNHIRTVSFRNQNGTKSNFSEGTELGEWFLELIKENSNDFTKDIATKILGSKYEISEKQAWCCAFQIVNNNEVYKIAINDLNVKF